MNRIILATVIAAIAIAPAAMAMDGQGQGKGNQRSHAAAGGRAIEPTVNAKDWRTTNGAVTNPAGRTHPHGMPPGQAKRWVEQNGGLRVGGILPDSYPGYQTLSAPRIRSLPIAPAGTEYVRVGDDVYLRQINTGLISTVLQGLLR